MKKFFRAIASAVPALAAVMFFGMSATRCTSVDDTLGQNFIPPHQQMTLRIDTLGGIDTYIAQNDTILSSNQGILFVGSMVDPVFGRTQASAMTDFFPQAIYTYTLSEAEDEDEDDGDTEEAVEYFGFKPAADSVFVDFIINDIKGTPVDGQRINIYELRDSLKRRDTLYYFNTPLETLVDMDKPLFSFEIEKERIVDEMVRYKLEPTAAGLDFMKRIVETDDEVYETPTYTFHKNFYGLYMAPAPDYPENAALYELNIRKPGSTSDFAGMFLWAHNYDKDAPTMVKDTLVAYFRFSDTYWSGSTRMMNVNHTVFTYPPQIADRINKTDIPMETVYVQGLGGVATYLKFSDGLLEEIKKLQKPDGEDEYSAMVINEARLYFPMDDPSAENKDEAPTRLGMYYTYGQPEAESANIYYPYFYTAPYSYVTPAFGPRPMADYAYYSENAQGSTTKSSFDGHLYRSQGYYKMNITSYMTLLLNYPDETPREMWLGPEVNTRHRDYTQVALKGSGREDNPVRLVLTYTLIK